MAITSKQLRESWLKFYESKGHVNVGAVSLIGDGTTGVMFNVAGMQPLMPYLLGKPHPLGKRLCNVQGCVRTVDIESVGDESHFTFFEMMGNWSLGDYFKKEKTAWTYELLTKVYGLDGAKLCSTVFEGNESAPRDEETAALLKGLGIAPDHVFYLPKSDNWWELEGTVGTPCGPDNEWFYPIDANNPSPAFPDDYVEIGNDVYMQYRKTEEGYVPLENKNVDTGFGLDRMLLFLNGLNDGYKTDLFAGAIAKLESLTGKSYDSDAGARKAMRIVADHVRTAVMLIGDVNGILPSNTGAGYILRRLMRRAIRYCRQLGVHPGETMQSVASVFIDEVYGEAYPLLVEKKEYILGEIAKEADRFEAMLEKGMADVLDVVALGRAARNAGSVKNRQPLSEMLVASNRPLQIADELAAVTLDELNVKKMSFVSDGASLVRYELKPQLRTLGPKYGKKLKAITAFLANCDGAEVVSAVRANGSYTVELDGEPIVLLEEDLQIFTQSAAGYATAVGGGITVALNTQLSEELLDEGTERELVSKIQTMRKEAGFEVTDRIAVYFTAEGRAKKMLEKGAFAADVLARSVQEGSAEGFTREVDVNGEKVTLTLVKA